MSATPAFIVRRLHSSLRMIMNVDVSIIMIKAVKKSARLFFLHMASSSDQTRKKKLMAENKSPSSQVEISE